jgi:hypothetical protein
MYSPFRNPQITWIFFRVVQLFHKSASRAALHQTDQTANQKVIFKALEPGLVDSEHQEKA